MKTQERHRQTTGTGTDADAAEESRCQAAH